MLKVIDNKKIDMTDSEWGLYQKIVQSYTTPTNKGEDLFIDLFETDHNGIITFLKPPSRRSTTMEVWLYLVSLQVHQQLRQMWKEVDDIVRQFKDKMSEIDHKLQKLEGQSKEK